EPDRHRLPRRAPARQDEAGRLASRPLRISGSPNLVLALTGPEDQSARLERARLSGDRDLGEDVMQIQALGHVVLRVTDQSRAERFYGETLGLPICARFDEDGMKMTFFTLGNHHDFAVMEVSGEDAAAGPSAVGLHHVAFKIGDRLDQLREA